MIAKLFAFGFLILIYSLSNRTQQFKIKKNLSDKTDIEFSVPHGSILGPLLFNIDIIDLFYECEDSNVASYADHTTPYSCPTEIPSFALELQASTTKLSQWFKNNHLKANPGKSHVLLSTKKSETALSNRISFTASSHEKLPGI